MVAWRGVRGEASGRSGQSYSASFAPRNGMDAAALAGASLAASPCCCAALLLRMGESGWRRCTSGLRGDGGTCETPISKARDLSSTLPLRFAGTLPCLCAATLEEDGMRGQPHNRVRTVGVERTTHLGSLLSIGRSVRTIIIHSYRFLRDDYSKVIYHTVELYEYMK